MFALHALGQVTLYYLSFIHLDVLLKNMVGEYADFMASYSIVNFTNFTDFRSSSLNAIHVHSPFFKSFYFLKKFLSVFVLF